MAASTSLFRLVCRAWQQTCILRQKGFNRIPRKLCTLKVQHINSRRYASGSSSFSWKSHNCGELRASDVGKQVTLCGWLQFQRMGLFATLRDAQGVTQLVIPDQGSNAASKLGDLSFESVIKVEGTVIRRPPGQENKKMPTGDIEVKVKDMQVLSSCKRKLPFNIREFQKVKEPLRLQYRYLDLRTPTMQQNLRLRSELVMKMREFLCNLHDFVDVETPTLFRRTPGGAHEFVVPTRFPGKFYSLTQSPQQFKQLLMVGGLDRYFQIAKCYRDEGTKPDRQPEFTQVDIEMSFLDQEHIMNLVEELLQYSWPSHLPAVSTPFRRLTYHEAMSQYGTDKPDVRFEMKLHDLSDVVKDTDALVLIDNVKRFQDGTVQAITVKGGVKHFSGSVLEEFVEMAKTQFGLEGMMFVKVKEAMHWSSMIAKYIPQSVQEEINSRLQILPFDLILIAAGPKANVLPYLGSLRLHVASLLESKGVRIVNRSPLHQFLWVTDFPLFLPSNEGGLESAHHPFTAPHSQDEDLVYSSPTKARSQHYDLVLNGVEIAGGSIRIHKADLQRHILQDVLKVNTDELFYLLEALESGCPPHGGIALGLDRLLAILVNANSIRDVIAFPKSFDGKDIMSQAPVTLAEEEKLRYRLQTLETTEQNIVDVRVKTAS